MLEWVGMRAGLLLQGSMADMIAVSLLKQQASVPSIMEMALAKLPDFSYKGTILTLTFGLVWVQPAGPVVEAARNKGLIVITAGKGDCIRMVPPLIITDDDVDICVDVLTRTITETVS